MVTSQPKHNQLYNNLTSDFVIIEYKDKMHENRRKDKKVNNITVKITEL